MKLETSQTERSELKAEAELAKRNVAPPILEPELLSRLLRDIDTLLAEVERLRAERRPFSDGFAQKVIDEQVKTIDAGPPAPPLPVKGGEHEWIRPKTLMWECCRKCGIIRRPDGKNSPCRGPVYVALRADESSAPLPAEVEEMRKVIERYLAETANPGETLYDGHPKVLLNRAASLLSRWPGGWRPISTAPKDGTLFLAWAPGREGLSSLHSLCAWHPDAGFCIDEFREPTHWQPIPEPPNE